MAKLVSSSLLQTRSQEGSATAPVAGRVGQTAQNGPLVSFIIVSYNTRELLDACLASIAEHTAIPHEVIVVDNASSDGSPAMLRTKYPTVKVFESAAGNVGFGCANNLGFNFARAPFVLLLNSDALLLNDLGSALLSFIRHHPQAGIVGPDVVLMDGSRQPKTHGRLPSPRVMLNHYLLLSRLFPRISFFGGIYAENTSKVEYETGWVSGVCMLIRREVFAALGGFDPSIFMYAEDLDLCRRSAALGWETWRVNAIAVKHLCGGSTKSPDQLLRLYVIQQRNFLKLLDASMGPAGRLVARSGLFLGLILRLLVRGSTWPVAKPERRVSVRADVRCLADFLGLLKQEEGHAHRA